MRGKGCIRDVLVLLGRWGVFFFFSFTGEVHLHVDAAALAVHDDILGLSTIEARWDFAVLTLTLVTASGGLTLAGSGTTASTNALVVGSRVVGEGG